MEVHDSTFNNADVTYGKCGATKDACDWSTVCRKNVRRIRDDPFKHVYEENNTEALVTSHLKSSKQKTHAREITFSDLNFQSDFSNWLFPSAEK